MAKFLTINKKLYFMKEENFYQKVGYLSIGKVWHSRSIIAKNTFNYRLFYLFINLDKISDNKSSLFSVNRFNLFSFYEDDYFKLNQNSLNNHKITITDYIRNLLIREGVPHHIKNIMLLTHPRVLGKCFNPVSFYFCINDDDDLVAVIAEVSNTFKETHYYIINNQDYSKIMNNHPYYANKEFFVSPFFERKGEYCFFFDYNPHQIKNNIRIKIDYYQEGEISIKTGLSVDFQDLTNFNIIQDFLKIPLMNYKVIFLIHWQALILLKKGVKRFKKPIELVKKFTKSYLRN